MANDEIFPLWGIEFVTLSCVLARVNHFAATRMMHKQTAGGESTGGASERCGKCGNCCLFSTVPAKSSTRFLSSDAAGDWVGSTAPRLAKVVLRPGESSLGELARKGMNYLRLIKPPSSADTQSIPSEPLWRVWLELLPNAGSGLSRSSTQSPFTGWIASAISVAVLLLPRMAG